MSTTEHQHKLTLHSLQFPTEVANAEDHFAAGDMVSWPGIKRCGTAMHMGYLVSLNVHQRMLQRLCSQTPEFQKLDPIPPMIGLAVGKKAVAYDPEGGLKSGEDIMKVYFGDDLGFSSKLTRIYSWERQIDMSAVCWNWMKLGEKGL